MVNNYPVTLDSNAEIEPLDSVRDVRINGESFVDNRVANIPEMEGATSNADGSAGVVPAPTSSDRLKYLRGDGTWQTVSGGGGGSDVVVTPILTEGVNIATITVDGVDAELYAPEGGEGTVTDVTVNGTSVVDTNGVAVISETVKGIVDGQGSSLIDQYGVATINIPTVPVTDVVDSTAQSLVGLNGVATIPEMSGATVSANGVGGSVPAPRSDDREKFLKGDGTWGTPTKGSDVSITQQLSSGTNVADITIDGTTTSLYAPTPPSDMTGASSSVAGSHGLVPAPIVGDQVKYLKGDGTWDTPTAGSTVTVTQKAVAGENIASITIDGTTTELYASQTDPNAVTDVTLNGVSVVSNHVANIVESVKGVVDGQGTSLVDSNGIAHVDVSDIAVVDVVDGNSTSLVDSNGVAHVTAKVTDVLFNGDSVVDANGVAEIDLPKNITTLPLLDYANMTAISGSNSWTDSTVHEWTAPCDCVVVIHDSDGANGNTFVKYTTDGFSYVTTANSNRSDTFALGLYSSFFPVKKGHTVSIQLLCSIDAQTTNNRAFYIPYKAVNESAQSFPCPDLDHSGLVVVENNYRADVGYEMCEYTAPTDGVFITVQHETSYKSKTSFTINNDVTFYGLSSSNNYFDCCVPLSSGDVVSVTPYYYSGSGSKVRMDAFFVPFRRITDINKLSSPIPNYAGAVTYTRYSLPTSFTKPGYLFYCMAINAPGSAPAVTYTVTDGSSNSHEIGMHLGQYYNNTDQKYYWQNMYLPFGTTEVKDTTSADGTYLYIPYSNFQTSYLTDVLVNGSSVVTDGVAYITGGSGGSTVTITPTISTGTKIADYSIDGTSGELYAPSGGGGGSTVSVTQKVSTGENIASITVDGVATELYATNTTYSDFDGATSQVVGTHGLVPAPTTSDTTKFLKGDGTWGTPDSGSDVSVTQIQSTGTKIATVTIDNVDTDLYAPNGGGGGSTVSIDRKVSTGENFADITIDGVTTSLYATNTTYSDFTGTNGTAAGTNGLVPAPTASDTNKYLKSDGTWATVSGGGGASSLDDLDDVEIITPSNGQVLKYNSTSQKWENGTGGGGNANMTELTQVEYDALTPAEKENGTMYLTHDGDEEVDLTVRMTGYTSTSGTASAVGSLNANFLAWHAFASEDDFDANLNGEYWAGNGEGAYLQFDFANAVSITKVAYASYQYSSFDLMYSTDGITYNLAETLTQADQGTTTPTKQDYILSEPIASVISIRFVCNGVYNIGALHIYGNDGNLSPNRIYLNSRKYAEVSDDITLSPIGLTKDAYDLLPSSQKEDVSKLYLVNDTGASAINMYYATKYPETNVTITNYEHSTVLGWSSGGLIGQTWYYSNPIDVTDIDTIKYDITTGSSTYGSVNGHNDVRNLGFGLRDTAPSAMTLINNMNYDLYNEYHDVNDLNKTLIGEELDVSELTGEYYLIGTGAGWNATISNVVLVSGDGINKKCIYWDDTVYGESRSDNLVGEEITLADYSALPSATKNDGAVRFIPHSNIGSIQPIDMTTQAFYQDSGNMNVTDTTNTKTTVTWNGGMNIGCSYYYATAIDVTDWDRISLDIHTGSCYGGGASAQRPAWDFIVGLLDYQIAAAVDLPASSSAWKVVADLPASNHDYLGTELDVSSLTGELYLTVICHGWNATVENITISTLGGYPSQIKYMDETYGIANIKELTEGEYNDLPNSEKNNGTVYFTYDGGYEYISYDNGAIIVRVDHTNNKTLWFFNGFAKNADDMDIPTELVPYLPTQTSAQSVMMAKDWTDSTSTTTDGWIGFVYPGTQNVKIRSWNTSHYTDAVAGWAVLDIDGSTAEDGQTEPYQSPYTSTTMQPNHIYMNGRTYGENPSMDNYSVSEQIVGKWVDGSTLYQKTYEVDTTSSSTQGLDITIDSAINKTNAQIISIDGIYTVGAISDANNSGWWALYNKAYYANTPISDIPLIVLNSTGLIFNTKQSTYGEIAVITVQYIKLS